MWEERDDEGRPAVRVSGRERHEAAGGGGDEAYPRTTDDDAADAQETDRHARSCSPVLERPRPMTQVERGEADGFVL